MLHTTAKSYFAKSGARTIEYRQRSLNEVISRPVTLGIVLIHSFYSIPARKGSEFLGVLSTSNTIGSRTYDRSLGSLRNYTVRKFRLPFFFEEITSGNRSGLIETKNFDDPLNPSRRSNNLSPTKVEQGVGDFLDRL